MDLDAGEERRPHDALAAFLRDKPVSLSVELVRLDGGISPADVENVIQGGRVIEDYSTAKPLPARLILGWIDSRPLHVVAAFDAASQTEQVVTAYEPDPVTWEQNFSVRRRKP